MTNAEKVKHIRQATLAPVNKINEALKQADWDLEKATGLIMQQMTKTDVAEMAKRQANATIVYSYVHNNRIGAMITIASQTDFVSKNELFLNLAKDICMHIVSTSIPPEYVSQDDVPEEFLAKYRTMWKSEHDMQRKPAEIQAKIIAGRETKLLGEICLLNQKFVRDETITIEQLINNVVATTREKIEVKRFTRMVAS